jgi:hypothetical protein
MVDVAQSPCSNILKSGYATQPPSIYMAFSRGLGVKKINTFLVHAYVSRMPCSAGLQLWWPKYGPCNLTPRHPPSQVLDNLPRYGS